MLGTRSLLEYAKNREEALTPKSFWLANPTSPQGREPSDLTYRGAYSLLTDETYQIAVGVREGLKKLSRMGREVVDLRYFCNLPWAVVAERMGLSASGMTFVGDFALEVLLTEVNRRLSATDKLLGREKSVDGLKLGDGEQGSVPNDTQPRRGRPKGSRNRPKVAQARQSDAGGVREVAGGGRKNTKRPLGLHDTQKGVPLLAKEETK